MALKRYVKISDDKVSACLLVIFLLQKLIVIKGGAALPLGTSLILRCDCDVIAAAAPAAETSRLYFNRISRKRAVVSHTHHDKLRFHLNCGTAILFQVSAASAADVDTASVTLTARSRGHWPRFTFIFSLQLICWRQEFYPIHTSARTQTPRATKEHLGKKSQERSVDDRFQVRLEEDGLMEAAAHDRAGWRQAVCESVFHWDLQGISQVSHTIASNIIIRCDVAFGRRGWRPTQSCCSVPVSVVRCVAIAARQRQHERQKQLKFVINL